MKSSESTTAILIRKAIKIFQLIEDSIIIVGVAFISLAVLMQAVFRYAIRSMPLGLEEMAIIVASWVYFIGLGVATRSDSHMVITIIDQVNLPRTLKKVILSLGDLLVVVISGAFAYFAISYAYAEHKAGIVIVPFNISELFNVGPLAIGMLMATIYASTGMIRRLIERFQ